MALTYDIKQLSSVLEGILGPEVTNLIEKINESPGTSGSPFIYLPDGADSTLSSDQVARLVARTSNEYARACRLAGLARAQFKIAEAGYKFKFRTSIGTGKNAAEREGKAIEAAGAEYEKMVLLEAIVELCESIESAARIASESSRRMLIGADQYRKADSRIELSSSYIQDSDFSTY